MYLIVVVTFIKPDADEFKYLARPQKLESYQQGKELSFIVLAYCR